MTIACLCGGDRGRISSAWLVACYALLSIAEVLLAPLGVSLITRLAPPKKEAQTIGLWFAASGVGSAVAAAQGLCWDRWPHHRYFYAAHIAGACGHCTAGSSSSCGISRLTHGRGTSAALTAAALGMSSIAVDRPGGFV